MNINVPRGVLVVSRVLATSPAWLLAAVISAASGCAATPASAPVRAEPLLGGAGAPSTGRDDLTRLIADARRRLRTTPHDGRTAVRLADALLRQARVTGNAGLASEADLALRRVTNRDPEDYAACRMLAAVQLSAHRFRGAIAEAERCQQLQENDAWIHGVLGDAHLELGDYEEAWDAFDRMMTLKPSASSYARAAYARELQGDLDGARALMERSLGATSPLDLESIAWHRVQLGYLYLAQGQIQTASREFEHAAFVFPGHPLAMGGRAHVAAARGDLQTARAIIAAKVEAAPMPDDLAWLGDLLAAMGEHEAAERHYGLAEAAWMSDAPDPGHQARFLAERDRRPADALALAETAISSRHDIFTEDALAWALYRNGRLDDAVAASTRALRTGSRDRTMHYHAAAIAFARGDLAGAREHLAIARPGSRSSDLVTDTGVEALARAVAVAPVRTRRR